MDKLYILWKKTFFILRYFWYGGINFYAKKGWQL